MSDPVVLLTFGVSYVAAGLVLLGVTLGSFSSQSKLVPVRSRRK